MNNERRRTGPSIPPSVSFVDPYKGIRRDPNFDLGVVVGSEKIVDSGHESYGEGYTFTGAYTVVCLSKRKTYMHVPALWTALGEGSQSGGIYPPHTVVLMCYVTPRKSPVILGAVSYSYLNWKEEEKLNIKEVNPEERISELRPGEQIIQASIKDVRESEEKQRLQCKGGYVRCDHEGGVRIVTRKDGSIAIIHGDPDTVGAKQTTITIVGERDADATVELKHSSGTTITISPTGAITIENVSTKAEHTTGNHTQNDDSNLLINVLGNTILTCNNIQLGADGGEKTFMGETMQQRFNAHTHMGNLGYPVGMPTTTGTQSTSQDLSDKVHTKK